MITYDEFQKIELKIAKITGTERIEGSEKLVILKLDLGDEQRQIVAGIGKYYDLEKIIGKEIVIVANLEPRILMGIESQGMLLAADDNQPVLLIPDKDVTPGARIK